METFCVRNYDPMKRPTLRISHYDQKLKHISGEREFSFLCSIPHIHVY